MGTSTRRRSSPASPTPSGVCPRTPAGRSPSTAGPSSPPTPSWPASSTWPATSATRTPPGRKGASRTRTAASAASCPATASPRRSRGPGSAASPTGSTTPRAVASATVPRARSSSSTWPPRPAHPNLTPAPVALRVETAVAGGAAGGHWDPEGTRQHRGPQGGGHLGDLPALDVAADGTAKERLPAPRITDLDRLKGHALVIHAGDDNYADQPLPLGGGGGRIACGVIR